MGKQTEIPREKHSSDQASSLPSDRSGYWPGEPSQQPQEPEKPSRGTPPNPGLQIGILRNRLQEIQDRYIILYDSAPVGYVTLNSTSEISESNLTLCAWLGTSKDHFIGTLFSNYVASGFHEIFSTHLKLVFSSNLKQKCEIRLKKTNGTFLPVSLESIAVRDSRGQLSQCYCTLCDMSDLEKQNELNRVHNAISDISSMAVLVTDKNLIFTQWNQESQKALGWTQEEILGSMAATAVRSKILEPLVTDAMMKSLAETGGWSGPVAFQKKDGSKLVSVVTVKAIWDNLGNFGGLAAVFNHHNPDLQPGAQVEASALESLVKERCEDLTRANLVLQRELNLHKQAALAARESEGKNRDLVDNIKLGIFRCTPGSRGRFLEVNKAMEEISGFSREELLQIYVCDLYTASANLDPFQNEINIADWKVTRELQLKKKSGSQVTVAVTIVAIRFESGTTQYCDGILEDVTERKLAQMQIQNSLKSGCKKPSKKSSKLWLTSEKCATLTLRVINAGSHS